MPVLNYYVDFTQQWKDESKAYLLNEYNNRITFESEATQKYNCHAYAWDEFTAV